MDACPNCTHATLHPQGMCLKDGCKCTSDVPQTVDDIIEAAKKEIAPPKEKSYSYTVWYVGGGTVTFHVKANEWTDGVNRVRYRPALSKNDHYVELTQVDGTITSIPWTAIMQLNRLPEPKPDEVTLDDL